MLEKARCQKLNDRISKLLEKYEISENFSYSTQEKDGVYQCVIKYQVVKKWKSLWVSTGYKEEKGNLRKAKKASEEIANIFKERILENIVEKQDVAKQQQDISFLDFQRLLKLNTTNYDPNNRTKADWDFYEYMEYWLYKIIKPAVELDTFNGYERNVTKRMKLYFTMKEHRKTVKEITATDLDNFYDYLREDGLQNATIDHYNDNISSAFNELLKKGEVRFNPAKMVNPIVVEIKEVPTYTKEDIIKLFLALNKEKDIELAAKFDSYYGLRRSEFTGLRDIVFDFEEHNFIINHVCIQNDGKKNKEKFYFKDKTKSKKGYRTFPLFPDIEKDVLAKFERIELCKKLFGDAYNHKYDGYLFVHDNGNFIQPNYITRRFKKIIERNNLKKVTPHGLRHSIATLLHLEGVDIRDLQDWLGHESISSTNRYARSDYRKQIITRRNCMQNI